MYCHSREKYILERTLNLMIQVGINVSDTLQAGRVRHTTGLSSSHELLEKVGMKILKALSCPKTLLITE